jgi:ATP-dependent Clp protease protease subunit
MRASLRLFALFLLLSVASSLVATPASPRRHRRSRVPMAMQTGAGGGGGGMVDGMRIGPPPDMPSLLLSNRIVYLGMPISAGVTELIIGELLYLQNESTEKPVIMYINSPGTTTEAGQPVGFESEAFAIYDTMNYCKAPVHTVLVGKAYGLAAMLLAAGTKGERSALKTGTVMLHQPRGNQAQGQASDIAIKAREVLINRNMALEIMAKDMGVSKEKLMADTNRCLYLDAQAAVDYGVVDKVVTKADRTKEKEVLSEFSRGIG